MKRTSLAFAVLALPVLAPALAAQEPGQEDERPPLYPADADARADIAAALALAKKENTRVLVQWGGEWCSWCHKLQECFTKDAGVRHELLYEYETVHVDIGRWDKNLDLAEHYGADLKANGVPFLTVLAADGSVLANQETGSLESEEEGKAEHDPKKVVAFLEKHRAPYEQAEDVLNRGLAAAQLGERRLFLSFGAPWCGWCHRLEGWVATPEVAAILGKDFVFLKLDVDRTVGGKELFERYRGPESTGIPWFVFLEPDGTVLADSGKGGANLGCPYTDEEIAAFDAILAKVARRITAEDRAALRQSLVAGRDPEDL